MKYLGVDWGLKKVGLALSEGIIATPYQTIEIAGLDNGVDQLLDIASGEDVDELIIGKPEGEMGQAVEKLAKELQKLGINFKLVDETLSTKEASQVMVSSGVGKNKRRSDNQVAAAIILQRWLDEK